MAVTLRSVSPSDESFCYRLYEALQIERLGWQNWNGPERDGLLRLSYNGFKLTYQNIPGVEDQVIAEEEEPVGRLVLIHRDREVRLADIALLPEARNRGLGTACLRLVMERARLAGKVVRLQVSQNNQAQTLYKRLGFVATGFNELDIEMEWSGEIA